MGRLAGPRALVVAVAALITVPVLHPMRAAGEESTTGCIALDPTGTQQVWYGETPPEISSFGVSLAELVDQQPDQATGVAYCSHYEGLRLYVTRPSQEFLSNVAALSAGYPNYPVQQVTVDHSLREQLDTMDAISRNPALTKVKNTLTPDMTTGGLIVNLPEVIATDPSVQDVFRDTAQAVSARSAFSSPVPLKFGVGGPTQANTRLHDSPRFYSGIWLSGPTGYCSSGLSLRVSGIIRMLTAGHCGVHTFTNQRSDGLVQTVGSTYTTAYPGNAWTYGDWQLISGSTYAQWTYSGGLNDSTVLRITGAVWGSLPKGQGMCTSGVTTFQDCHFHVLASQASDHDNNDVPLGMLYVLYHYHYEGSEQVWDDDGTDHGDSGGPCYFADGTGGVTAAGIVQGKDSRLPNQYLFPHLLSYCTMLGGVKKWNTISGGSGVDVGES